MADIDIDRSGSPESAVASDSGQVVLNKLILKPVDTSTVSDTKRILIDKLILSRIDRSTVSDILAVATCELGSVGVSLQHLWSTGDGYSSAEADLTFDPLDAIGTLLTGTVGTGSLVFSQITIEAGNTTHIGDASLIYPSLEQTSSGLTGTVGTLDRDLYGFMDVSGTLIHPSDATVDITLPLISVSGSLLYGNNITSALSFFPQINASGYTGEIGTANNDLTLLEIVASSGGSSTGQASIVLPLFTMGDIQQTGTITIGPFKVYSFNTENFAVSSFSNFIFDSFADFNGSYIASSSSGLFLLSGDTDYGTNITMEIFKERFIGDVRNKKRIKSIFAAMETDGMYEMDIIADNRTYSYTEKPVYSVDDGIQTIRMKVGKGLSGRYFSVKLRNKGGSNIKLKELGLEIEMSERSGRL